MGIEEIRARIREQKLARENHPEIDFSDEELEAVGTPRQHKTVLGATTISTIPGVANDRTRPANAVQVSDNAKQSVIDLYSLPMDTEFVVYTRAYYGELYVNSMRQIISRVRKTARRENVKIVECKMLVVGEVENFGSHDKVTLIRTQASSLKQRQAYGEVLALMAPEKEAQKS